jgi:hypothetical protein
MTSNCLSRVACNGESSVLAAVQFDDPAEFVINLVIWLCSLVVIACSFLPLLF